MIPLLSYKGKIVAVFGLGKAGEATVASLLAGGSRVLAWDDAMNGKKPEELPKPPSPDLLFKPFTSWPWKNIDCLVLSPGVPYTHPAPHAVVEAARKAECPIIGDIELLFQTQTKARYAAITGTNGKSTTTSLLGHILKQRYSATQVGGNLGTPALALAPLDKEKEGIYVLELSSYQLDLVRTTRFNAAVLLNLTPDHLDRHGDMDGYIKAKVNIFERQEPEDAAIIAVDDDRTRRIARVLHRQGKKVIEVSHSPLKQGIGVDKGALYEDGNLRFSLLDIATLTGQHNWQNAAAAYATARFLGMDTDAIAYAMRSFPGLAHRLELVATINGVRFINDSKATNADATQHALAAYDTIYWIAGGKPKAGGIVGLAAHFKKIAHAFLIGEAEADFARTLEGKVATSKCGTLASALDAAAEMAFKDKKKGAVVLLSPACASFDQWKNFEARGDAFRDMVKKMEMKGNA